MGERLRPRYVLPPGPTGPGGPVHLDCVERLTPLKACAAARLK